MPRRLASVLALALVVIVLLNCAAHADENMPREAEDFADAADAQPAVVEQEAPSDLVPDDVVHPLPSDSTETDESEQSEEEEDDEDYVDPNYMGDVPDDEKPSGGFGDLLPWLEWDDGDVMEKLRKNGKPTMILFHKSWCGACHVLKKKFQPEKEQARLNIFAKYFNLIQIGDDGEPAAEKFAPDGRYVPRVIFLAPDGQLLKEVHNEAPDYKNQVYYYSEISDIMMSMRKVMGIYGLGGISIEDVFDPASLASQPNPASDPQFSEASTSSSGNKITVEVPTSSSGAQRAGDEL